MIHEEALKAALAGGPRDAGLARHVEECLACRTELEALRALEGELRLAAGSPHRNPGWEARVERRLTRSGQTGRTWTTVAASCLLASALVLSWTVALPGVNTSGGMAGAQAPPPALRAVASPAGGEAAPGAWISDEDSTAMLLQVSEPLADELRQGPPDALRNYLSHDDSGGWNG